MQPPSEENRRYIKTFAVSVAIHGLALALLALAGPDLARAARERAARQGQNEIAPIPITWVFSHDGHEGAPAAAGGKRVQETPALAKGAPGGENTPTPPPEPDRTKPHGDPEPKPAPPSDATTSHHEGTVPVEKGASTGPPTDKPVTEPGRAQGDPNGQSGAPEGRDANTSGEQATGGGPSRGAGYGGPGFNGPARSKQAQNEGWHGRVTVVVRLGPTGQPTGASVAASSGIPGLDQECVRRVLSAPASDFTPALNKGVAIEGSVSLSCDFPPAQ